MMHLAVALALATLTSAEKRGREIFLHGETSSGRAVTATLAADSSNPIAGSVLACASCHGADGRGVAEGVVTPADVRWSTLSKPLVAEGRRRIAYDDASLPQAIGEAQDPSGAPLSAAMPRFKMDARDLADLVAFMHKLGNEPQPGLADDALTVATIAPRGAEGDLMRATIAGYFDDVNAAGGVYGRKLKLQAAVGDAFAIVGASGAVPHAVTEERIPLITPYPLDAPSPSAFSLFADLETQAKALLDVAAQRGTAPRLRRFAVIDDGTPGASAAAEAALAHADALGWPRAGAGELSDNDVLLLVGDVKPPATRATLLLAGTRITEPLFARSNVFTAFPTLPSDVSDAGARELDDFAVRHHLARAQRPAAIAPYVAAKLFVEALRRVGRDVTRERLIAALEQVYELPTGLTPPLTYSATRHIGAAGAYVVALDAEKKTFVPAGGWIAAE